MDVNLPNHNTRIPYEAPTVEVVEVRNEGIICGSGGTEDYNRPDSTYNW